MKELLFIFTIILTIASCSQGTNTKSLYDEDSRTCFTTRIEKCYSNWDKLSNVEKNRAIENGVEVINDLDLYLIHTNSKNYNDWSSKMGNYRQWHKLTAAVERFLELKSTFQWYTHKTGTAGASYAPCGKRDMSIAHYLYIESILKDPSGKEFSDELGLLGKSKLLPSDSIHEYNTQINEIVREYLYSYFAESKDHFERGIVFYYPIEERGEIEKIYDKWKQDTEQTISDILKYIPLDFSEYFDAGSNAKVNPIKVWLYVQVLHILKYYD